MNLKRCPDNRRADALRPVVITRNYLKSAEGSCLIEMGDTRVLCTASIEERLPRWRRSRKEGWVTAEYGMLPRATQQRTTREASMGKQGGRTLEIQRMIGRALRTVTNLAELGQRTIWIDCDVLQADGGTRTAAVTGAYMALMDACRLLKNNHIIKTVPLTDFVAAVSCGIVSGIPVLDLDYQEDSSCETDMNFVMTGSGEFVEIQGTAEKKPFTQEAFNAMLTLAGKGIQQLITQQRQAMML